MDPSCRPDDKFRKYGPKALSDAELLAIILRAGTKDLGSIELSREILKGPTGAVDILNIFSYDLDSLRKIKGIGNVKATQIMAIAELSLRIANSSLKKDLSFKSPSSVAAYYTEQMRHLNREIIKLLMLDSSCALIKEMTISEGTVNASLLSPREVYVEALKANAVNIILLHNHPSGNPAPSSDDISSTAKIIETGKMIGIRLLDHIIIGDRKYFSFKEEGMIDE